MPPRLRCRGCWVLYGIGIGVTGSPTTNPPRWTCSRCAPTSPPNPSLFTVDTDALPRALAAVVGDPLTLTRLTRLLCTRSLARVDKDIVQLHRLVQAILDNRLADQTTQPDVAVAAVTLLARRCPP